jgi:aspartate-semialdehyde dehydrogenase
MAERGHRVALLGATGTVGQELLEVLEERRFPIRELRAFASEGSAGAEIGFRGEELDVEPVLVERRAALEQSDLVFCAAPGILDELLPALRASETRIVDLSGSLELDPEVPLHRIGSTDLAPGTRSVAIPRGVAAGLGLALEPLQREIGLARLTVVTLESASGAGRDGVGELSEQTVQLLNAMTGEVGAAVRFSQPLAFDCLPVVGGLLEGGETSEEERLRLVVRRLLERPDLLLEATRVRVPVFAGSLTLAHVELESEASPERIRKLWEARVEIEVLDVADLPTPRTSGGLDRIRIGRIRASGASLAFAVALDDLRLGSAVAAVEAAEALMRSA